MEIRDADGDVVGTARVDELRRLDAGETAWPTAFADTLPAGDYTLTWGAPDYGSQTVNFTIVEVDGRLYMADDAPKSAAPGEDDEQEQLVEQAIADLASELEIKPQDIQVVEIQPREFADASLGVPEPGQMYAQMITPGYVITLAARGRQHIYHAAGERVVAVPEKQQKPGEGMPTDLVDRAIENLAMDLKIGLNEVKVLEVVPTNFRDSSLGVQEPGQVYLPVVTPGYIIHLQARGETYVYHASENRIVQAPSDNDSGRRGQAEELTELAIADLSQRLNISPTKIELASVEPTEFRDASLGVPEPGKVYIQIITPGYVIQLKAQGQTFTYHGTGERIVFVPDDSGAAETAITITTVHVEQGKSILIAGTSSLPEGAQLQVELWADTAKVAHWPADATAQVSKSKWEAVVPLENASGTIELDPQQTYQVRVYQQNNPTTMALPFPFDLAGPEPPSR